MRKSFKAQFMRGGSSKGLFFYNRDLPENLKECDQIFLKAIGSPDLYEKQLNGLGGGTSNTSKVAIIERSTKDDFDVEVLFGQVDVGSMEIDYVNNCGNMIAAVAVYAIENHLVETKKNALVSISIWQKNSNMSIKVIVETDENGLPKINGECCVAGVSGNGSPIQIELDLSQIKNKQPLFPTGNLIDNIVVDEQKTILATCINAGVAAVFVRACDIGMKGTELPAELNENNRLKQLFEKIRHEAAVKMRLKDIDSHLPKVIIISKPTSFKNICGDFFDSLDIDISYRVISFRKPHHGFCVTAGMALSIAAKIPRTLVYENLTANMLPTDYIRVGHPAGITKILAEVNKVVDEYVGKTIKLISTARTLMKGEVLVDV